MSMKLNTSFSKRFYHVVKMIFYIEMYEYHLELVCHIKRLKGNTGRQVVNIRGV